MLRRSVRNLEKWTGCWPTDAADVCQEVGSAEQAVPVAQPIK